MPQRSHFDVLVIGSASVDIVFSGMPHWPRLGHEMFVNNFAIGAGSIFNTAATLSRLGLRVGLLTDIGNDFFSRYILEEIDRFGISRDLVTVHDFPLRSISICLAHEGERGFVSYTDPSRQNAVHMVDALALAPGSESRAAIEHSRLKLRQSLDSYDIGAVFLYVAPDLLSLLDLLAGRGATIFFDAGWHPDKLADARLSEVIKRGHVVMPNQMEAMFMTETQTAEDAVRKLAELAPTAIVKVGAQGVIACQGGQLVRCPAYPVEEVVDTTGAGDAFNGGFIYGTLKGYALPDALRCGTICGSLSTTALTGTAALPTAEELERYL